MKNSKRIWAAFMSIAISMMMVLPVSATKPDIDVENLQEQTTDTITAKATKAITPNGNLTLVDDFSGETTSGKQFVTLVTKNGNYFYLIIDRDDEGRETVHFLNQVDEADLLDLMDEEEIENLGLNEETVIDIVPEKQEEIVVEDSVVVEKSKVPTAVIVSVVMLALGIVIVIYAKMKNMKTKKNKEKNPEPEEEEYFEFMDLDKEFENEDLEEELF